jgi:hypothetical protein
MLSVRNFGSASKLFYSVLASLQWLSIVWTRLVCNLPDHGSTAIVGNIPYTRYNKPRPSLLAGTNPVSFLFCADLWNW